MKKVISLCLVLAMVIGMLPAAFAADFTVSFDLNGGEGTAPSSQSVPFGESFTDPGTPTHADPNLMFGGWYTSDGWQHYPEYDSVEEDLMLYADWLLDLDSGETSGSGEGYSFTVSGEDEKDVQVTLSAGAPSIRLPGKNYGEVHVTINVTEDVTITALTESYNNYYSTDTVTITGGGSLTVKNWSFGGGGNDHALTIDEDTEVTLDAISFGQSGGSDSTLRVNGTLTVGSVYCGQVLVGARGNLTARKLTVNGMVDGVYTAKDLFVMEDGAKARIGDGTEPAIVSNARLEDGETPTVSINLPNGYLRNGYQIVEIIDEFGNRYANIDDNDGVDPDYEDYELVGVAYLLILPMLPDDVTVSFDANGGVGRMADQSVPYDTATALTANEFTREGYGFVGWNTEADGSGTTYDDEASVTLTEDLTLYAQWTERSYTVIWNAEGTEVDRETVAYGADATKNPTVPEKEGHSGAWEKSATNVTGDVVINAVYTPNRYTVTFDTDGGSVIDPITREYGSAISAPSNPTKSGYRFDGWTKDGASAEIPTTMPAEDITLKAIWKKVSTGGGGGGGGSTRYTVSFETDGGSRVTSQTVLKNGRVSEPAEPQKEGYLFGGWYVDADCTVRYDFDAAVTRSMTLHAKWSAAPYVPGALNGTEHFAYINGYADNTVRPLVNITRAEVAVIFYRLLKADIREANHTSENGFTDVAAGAWYNDAVSTMAALGVLKGYEDGTFRPNAPITRAEFAAIAARFDTETVSGDAEFADLAGHWAKAEVEKAALRGWVKGYQDGTFRPAQNITRAEAITLINRVLARVPKSEAHLMHGMKTWSDNTDTDAWYYLAIQEATNDHTYTYTEEDGETWTALS